ncbi:MAG: dicarboxylate/amino acid:cation symporter [Micavibrio sp.]
MLSKNLWKHVLAGMVGGCVMGLALSPSGGGFLEAGTALALGEWLALPGVIFLNLISMVILPLVLCSIILGITGSNDTGFIKRIGGFLIFYFVLTSFITVSAGIWLATVIDPGSYISSEATRTEAAAIIAAERAAADDSVKSLTIPDRIAGLVPKNVLHDALYLDLLNIVIFAIIIGVVLLTLPRDKTKTFLELCDTGQLMSMKIIGWAMHIAPLAVFGLISNAVIKSGPAVFAGLGGYVFTVLAGLALVMLFYMAIVVFLGRRSPLEFIKACRDVQLLAFSTSSSAAVMPFTLQTAEEKLGIHPDTARFTVPLGATINMDGTGIYQAIAAVFLCQIYGIDLSFVEMLALIATVVGASIGTPSTPGVGIVILATIVTGLGVPPAGIGLILGVDRILDMCRTAVNVTGDLVACTVIERWIHPHPRKTIKAAKDSGPSPV